ncbi:Zn-ribbon containing protein [Haloferax sp. DFSO60]|uniref:OapC/ArvC family zinc-ribbon domain-containing protein n=1 Tax=Haloferax sp. DFSO60 TaxID=3388652 RepID=UPI00397BC345
MPHQCTTCGKVFPDGSKQMLSGCPSCGGNKFQFQPATTKHAGESDSDAAGNASGTGTRDLTSSAADAVRNRAAQATDPPTDDSNEEMSVSDWVNSQQTPEPEPSGSPTTADSSPTDDSATFDDENSSVDSGGSESPEQARGWGEWPSKPGEDDEPQSSQSPESPRSNQQQTPPRQPSEGDHPIRARIEEDEDNSQRSARSDVVSPEELAAYRETNVESSPSTSQTPSEAPTPESRQHAHETDASSESPRPEAEDGTVIEPESDERPSLDDLREELNDQFESIKILSPGQYELNLMELYDRDEYIISLKEDGRYVIEVPDSWGPGNRDD